MRYVIIALPILLLLVACASEPKIYPEKDAKAKAQVFIESSPTYLFDGSDLTFVNTTPMVCNGCYELYYTFTSQHPGYGSREGQELTQKDQMHVVKIVVINDNIPLAEIDGVWDIFSQNYLTAIGDDNIVCAADVQMCPDGSAVARDPANDCAFAACPIQEPQGCDDPTRKYVTTISTQCESIKVTCDTGYKPFADDCGCGCEPEFIPCEEKAQEPVACTMEYVPVCGYRGVQCVIPPCPPIEVQTFGNVCSACADERVTDYVLGECPAPS